MPTAAFFGVMNCALYQAPIRYLRSAAISLCLSGILNTCFSVAGFDQYSLAIDVVACESFYSLVEFCGLYFMTYFYAPISTIVSGVL